MFNFTPLLGAQSASPASQSLLELDGGVKVLIDVGWDDDFDVEKLKALERQVPTLSLILLTHATSAHIAAFAHCCKHIPLFARIPIYATTPVISLGRTLLQDLYASTPLAATVIPASSLSGGSYSYPTRPVGEQPSILLQRPTNQEIITYFSLIHPLKYSQPHQPLGSPFSPPLNGLTITAYNAGHTLGGTIWHIQHGMESIVYAIDWNQARENTLAGAAWLGGAGAGGGEVVEQLRKPTALVCSSRGAETTALSGGRKKRDELLLDMIKSTLARKGTVLIPTDSSARVLELAYLLEHTWRKDTRDSSHGGIFRSARLYLASKNIGATMRYARSMLEWMDDGIAKELEGDLGGANPDPQPSGGRPNQARGGQAHDRRERGAQAAPVGPFDFKFLKLLERKKQIDRLFRQDSSKGDQPTGRVILASDTSLQWGFSKDALQHIAADGNNLIILTERYNSAPGESHGPVQSPHKLGATLWKIWEERKDGVAVEVGSDGQHVEQAYGGGVELEISEPQRVALEAHDLSIYQQYLATQRQMQTTIQPGDQTVLSAAAEAADDSSSSSSSSSDESDNEKQGKSLNISATLAHSSRSKLNLSNEDLGINVLLRRKGVYDFDVRGKKGREKMFPFVVKRKRVDDYGEAIRPEEYLRAEEREEVDGGDRQAPDLDQRVTSALGQKRKWDEGGAQAGPGRRSSLGPNKRRQNSQGRAWTEGETNQTSQPEANHSSDSDDSDAEEEEAESSPPSKLVLSSNSIRANLRVAFVDFAGLHDKRSLQMLIPLIQPRKLILTSGMKDETLALAEYCRQLLGAQTGLTEGKSSVEVFTPAVGHTIDANMDTNSWVLKLSESLLKRMHWQSVRGLGVVHVTGMLAAPAPTTSVSDVKPGSSKKQKVMDSDTTTEIGTGEEPSAERDVIKAVMPTLDAVPTSMATATRSVAQPLHVGDLRLADLRKLLQGSGHTAEFRGEGTLLVDGIVAVRKSRAGRIEVEGGGLSLPGALGRMRGLEGSFYAVKRKVYEGLAVVTGA